MRHAGRVVTRTMLLESVWDFHFDPKTNIVETHMSRLRGKIDRGQAPRADPHRARRRLHPARAGLDVPLDQPAPGGALHRRPSPSRWWRWASSPCSPPAQALAAQFDARIRAEVRGAGARVPLRRAGRRDRRPCASATARPGSLDYRPAGRRAASALAGRLAGARRAAGLVDAARARARRARARDVRVLTRGPARRLPAAGRRRRRAGRGAGRRADARVRLGLRRRGGAGRGGRLRAQPRRAPPARGDHRHGRGDHRRRPRAPGARAGLGRRPRPPGADLQPHARPDRRPDGEPEAGLQRHRPRPAHAADAAAPAAGSGASDAGRTRARRSRARWATWTRSSTPSPPCCASPRSRAAPGARRSAPCDLAAIAATVVEAFAPSAEDQRQSLDPSRGSARLSVDGDAELLTQMLVNLVENALRHAGPGARHRGHRSARPAKGAVLSVIDDGPGVPEAERRAGVRPLLPPGAQPLDAGQRPGPGPGRGGRQAARRGGRPVRRRSGPGGACHLRR